MRFAHPWFLLLLSVVPLVGLLGIWFFVHTQQRMALLVAPALQEKLMPRQRRRVFYTQLTLAMLGAALLIFAAARPQWGQKEETIFTRGRNVVIALDVSRSMLATDVHPNRLERAKADIMDLIDDLRGDRAALLAFRNKGSLICPLTTDYAFLRQALDGATPESAARGETNLGDAIRKSLDAFDPELDEYNAILLVSDGEDLTGGALAAAADAAKRNIPIFTVGIGGDEGAHIPAPEGGGVQQYKGSAVQTRLVEQTMKAIAEASNGRYIPLGISGTAHTTLGAIYRNHLRNIAAREQQELLENRYQERFQLFLIPAILALLGAAWLTRGRLMARRRRLVTASALVLVAWGVSPLHAQVTNQVTRLEAPPEVEAPRPAQEEAAVLTGQAGARQAQKLLRREEYQAAATAFLTAAEGADLTAAERYRYNAAYAWWQGGEITNAISVLRPLLTSRKLGTQAAELLGKLQLEESTQSAEVEPVARYTALDSAALAFQQAWRALPEDERAQRNFERAVAPLAAARSEAHIAKVLEKHGQTPPDQLMQTLLQEQRALQQASAHLMTNQAPQLIVQAEALAERQEQQADLWIPLKQQLLTAVTNQQQQAEMVQMLELSRDRMRGASLALQDLLPQAPQEVAQNEPIVYNFWKMLASAPATLDEDIMCQSNAIQKLDLPWLEQRDSQSEALELTQLFRAKFPSFAEALLQQAQSDTNAPAFTPEDQAKIEELAAHAEQVQREVLAPECTGDSRLSLQRQALDDLLEIRDLLPKQSGDQGQQGAQPPPEQEQEDQEQQQEQEEPEAAEDEEQQPPEEPEATPEPEELPQDVEELLRRALEREKEHEEQKKERMRNLPILPGERDW